MNRTMRVVLGASLLTLSLAQLAGAKDATPGPRRLDDVHIEGEIPVPQVLFITTREQRRFMDFHHRRYLRTSLELGTATPLPVWSTVASARPVEDRKETQP